MGAPLLARRLMAGHRSLEPAVVVRIHPGQSPPPPPVPGRPSTRCGRLFFLLVLALPDPLQALQPPRDSLDLLNEARAAQRAFETIHRNSLPVAGDSWAGGVCDEQIGRICLRFEGDEDWEPAQEDSAVSRARNDLLEMLAEVGGKIPGDRWVLGQRIRYLGDVGRWGEAVALARSGCRGDPAWWCDGLQGYALHRGGKVLEAQEAFQRALDGMDPRRARAWRDPTPLLGYAQARWLRSPEGLRREEALDRFWRLADPLFLTPGNEALTEHYARRFGILLLQDAALTMGFPLGLGLEQLLIRYGFPAGWDRTRPGFGQVAGGSVVEHHHPEARYLLPPLDALEDPGGLPEGVWAPGDRRPPSAMAPVLAPLVAEGSGQTAVLRRGSNLLVVAAYGVPRDTVFLRLRPWAAEGGPGGGGVEPGIKEGGLVGPRAKRPPWEPSPEELAPDTLSGLFLLPVKGVYAPFSALGSGGRGVLQLEAPPGEYLLSLELWDPAGLWGARVRHGVKGGHVPPDVPALSETLLLEKGGTLPEGLREALPRMLPSTGIGADQALTVAWEVYGLGRRREPLTFRISVEEDGASLIRRAFERVGLFRRPPLLTLSWTEAGSDAPGPLFRAVDLDLPELDPGRYILRLEMGLPYRSNVMSQRRLTVF